MTQKKGGSTVQIYIVNLELLQAGFQGVLNIANVLGYLCHHVEFLSRNATLLDGGAKLGLGLIHYRQVGWWWTSSGRDIRTLGAIKMSIAELDSCLHAINDSLVNLAFISALVPGCSGAVPEHWDRRAVIELQRRNRSVDICHFGVAAAVGPLGKTKYWISTRWKIGQGNVMR